MGTLRQPQQKFFACWFALLAASCAASTSFPAASLVAIRTPVNGKTGAAEAVFLDVIDVASGNVTSTLTLPSTTSDVLPAFTLVRSTVMGALARSDEGCVLSAAGYDVDAFTANAASTARAVTALLVYADGHLDVSQSDGTLSATARGAALVGGSYVLTSDGGLRAPSPLGVRDFAGSSLVSDNVRGVAVWRGSVLVTTASNSNGAVPGLWRVNAPGAPIVAPASGLLGELLVQLPYTSGVDQGPYGVAVVDDLTILIAEETGGLVVLRSNATLTPPSEGWHIAPLDIRDPDSDNLYAGFTHVGADPSTGLVVVVTSYDAAVDDDDYRETEIFEVVHDADWTTASLRLIATSPYGFDYRGVQPAPRCASFVSPTPLPPAGSSTVAGGPSAAVVGGSVGTAIALVGLVGGFFWLRSSLRAVAALPSIVGPGSSTASAGRVNQLSLHAGGRAVVASGVERQPLLT